MSQLSRKSSFYLTKLLGTSVQIKIIEILLRNTLEEQIEGKILWKNFSTIASQAQVAKSSGKRILDLLIQQGYVEEKRIETHAQTPPRMVRLNANHPAITELIFFFKKVRGFL